MHVEYHTKPYINEIILSQYSAFRFPLNVLICRGLRTPYEMMYCLLGIISVTLSMITDETRGKLFHCNFAINNAEQEQANWNLIKTFSPSFDIPNIVYNDDHNLNIGHMVCAFCFWHCVIFMQIL